nr:hypothetical protein Iba_chr03dCG3940 [Ipomoea batatas]
MAGDSFLSKPQVFTAEETTMTWSGNGNLLRSTWTMRKCWKLDEVPALLRSNNCQMREYEGGKEEDCIIEGQGTCIHLRALADEFFKNHEPEMTRQRRGNGTVRNLGDRGTVSEDGRKIEDVNERKLDPKAKNMEFLLVIVTGQLSSTKQDVVATINSGRLSMVAKLALEAVNSSSLVTRKLMADLKMTHERGNNNFCGQPGSHSKFQEIHLIFLQRIAKIKPFEVLREKIGVCNGKNSTGGVIENRGPK